MKIEGIVLAGGSSSRMGWDKAGLAFQGRTFLEQAVGILQAAELPVRIIAARESVLPDLGIPVSFDRFPGTGPLGALATALGSTSTQGCCCIPIDMPLLTPGLYRLLMRRADRAEILIPRDTQSRLHPLCGFYSAGCGVTLVRLVKAGERRVQAVCGLKDLRVVFLDPEDHGLPDVLFLNVNRPEDLALLSRRESEEQGREPIHSG